MSNDNAKMQQMEAVLKKSLITIRKLEAEIAELKEHANGDIAIIGMGCRMPAGIRSAEDLWKLLIEKRDAVTEIPEDRWDKDSTYDEDPLAPGKTNTKYGAFIEDDVKAFDAEFFGISPREARSIDPIQRILLELTQETLEQAGIAPDKLRGSNTGVYLGIGNNDYSQARLRSGNLEDVSVYDTTGIPLATASGRISYQFDLQGPSFTVDAACSSTLVAIHLAADALRRGECDLAVTGSANLLLTPELFIGLTKLGSLSPDGKCRAFDEHGNGYVRGEGAAVVLLKRLDSAIAAGDNILAVIKGSAIIHDGLSNGYTAPNPEAQLKVMQAAIKAAGVDPSTVGFVESHGVGNKFTDALEIQTLEQVYGKKEGKLYVGSVKPNLGHMEAAIGMAMLAKVIGAIHHRQVPPNINFETPNTDIDWNKISVEVPTDLQPWENSEPLRAAIHLTSYNGTNTHMIIEEWKGEEASQGEEFEWPACTINLSAGSREGLETLVDHYINENDLEENDLQDLAFTLATGRSPYEHKISVYATSVAELKEILTAYRQEGKHKLVKPGHPEIVRNKQVAFMFTGQGAQYHGMCRTLFDHHPVFRREVDKCASILDQHLDRSILDVIYGEDDGAINQTEYTQPALFVVEYALARLWQYWGIQPVAVVGHSVGEYVALTIAGILELEDALALIAARGKFIQSLPTGIGGMAAVLGEEDLVKGYLDGRDDVDIAAVNSPKSLTISGKKETIEDLVARMKEDKVKAIPLKVSHAFHSYQMDPILKDFEEVVSRVKLHQPKIPVISNLTGKELRLEELTPQYFSSHIRGTVRFMDNICYLDKELGIDIFLEAGPNPTLAGLAKQCLDKETALELASARKGVDERKFILETMERLYLSDVKVDWKAFYGKGRKRLDLPTYPWQRREYWYDPVHGLGGETRRGSASQPVLDPSLKTITRDNLMELMQTIAVRVLGLEPGSQLDIYKSMREQGFDSMMSGELLATLEKYLDCKLEMSLIHVYADLNSLYNYIVKEIMGEEDSITLSEVMFDSGGNGFGSDPDEGSSKDWHTIRDSDGPSMLLFKKLDKKLGVND
jgi:malonyl CoA-acyl carrier protein transacylase